MRVEVKTILAKNPALQAVTLPFLARAVHGVEAKFAARLEQARETTMVNTMAAKLDR